MTQINRHPQTVHSNHQGIPDYPGFVISNETTHWTMDFPKGETGDLQVGAGTVINFNIAVARRSKKVLLVDQSPEVVAMNMSYYRPLFLAAETPAELAAFIAGVEPRPGETVSAVFDRVKAGAKGSDEGLAFLDKRLAKLAQSRKISALDRKFAMAVAHDEVHPPTQDGVVPVFNNVRRHNNLIGSFMELYDLDGRQESLRQSLAEAESRERRQAGGGWVISIQDLFGRVSSSSIRDQIAEEQEKFAKSSFMTEEGFGYIKGLFRDKQVHYAQANLESPELWRDIKGFAEREKRSLSDLYVSNIPSVSRNGNVFKNNVLYGLLEVPQEKLVWIEAPYTPHSRFTNFHIKQLPGESAFCAVLLQRTAE